MTQITVNEDFQPNKYLLISRVDETQSIQTTRVLITDENTNLIRVVNIEQGPQGLKEIKETEDYLVKTHLHLMYCLLTVEERIILHILVVILSFMMVIS